MNHVANIKYRLETTLSELGNLAPSLLSVGSISQRIILIRETKPQSAS